MIRRGCQSEFLKMSFRSVQQAGPSYGVEFLPRSDALFVTRSMRHAGSFRPPDDLRRPQTDLRATVWPNRKRLLDSERERMIQLGSPRRSGAFERRFAPYSSPRS